MTNIFDWKSAKRTNVRRKLTFIQM